MFSQAEVSHYLQLTIELAETAFNLGNYPIGCVLVDADKTVVTKSMNECSTRSDITAHAEMLILQKLKEKVHKDNPERYYLFTSLEPCFGCSFFIARTNIRTIYSALKDPHKGGISDLQAKKDFADFFAQSEIINEPVNDLKRKSAQLMHEYFLRSGNVKAAEFYQ